jgi:hypothetical protein
VKGCGLKKNIIKNKNKNGKGWNVRTSRCGLVNMSVDVKNFL